MGEELEKEVVALELFGINQKSNARKLVMEPGLLLNLEYGNFLSEITIKH